MHPRRHRPGHPHALPAPVGFQNGVDDLACFADLPAELSAVGNELRCEGAQGFGKESQDVSGYEGINGVVDHDVLPVGIATDLIAQECFGRQTRNESEDVRSEGN